MIKILFVVDAITVGGKERQLLELIKGLLRSGKYSVEVVTFSTEVFYKEYLNLPVKINYLIRKRKKDFGTLYRLFRICKQYRPDIIHAWDSMSAIYAFPVSKLLNVKLVNGFIRNAPAAIKILDKPWIRKLIAFPFSNLIVANSNAGLRAYKAPAGKSICIYNGFDFSRLDNLEDPSCIRKRLDIYTKYVVGMVAEFSDSKDYDTFIEASKHILGMRQDVTFIMVGSGKNSEKSKMKANNHPQMRFLGNQSNIESIINIFDIGVLCSFTEGISNSIMEYMALSKPVLATDCPGNRELVFDKTHGFLVQTRDKKDLIDKIICLIDNEELAKTMGANGRERIEVNFSIQKMISSFEDAYIKIVGTK